MTSSPILCDNCSAQNLASESFCVSCGYALTASATTPSVPSKLTGQLPTRALLKQRYRVLQTIGQGGMGAVYQAEDTQLGNRLVAVKEMSQDNLYGQQARDAVESFQREAHLLAGLQHPNLPSIHDYFEEAGRWYLVMSFIQGETLADYLGHSQNHRLSLEETLSFGQILCQVLSYLHTHQPPIIFRDLKPSNIMRTQDGHIYLIDFGIARHFKPGQAKDTASYGSMGYAPPEQYGKAQTTERSDIYSLGATLYECLSGYDPSQSPFRFPPLQTLVPTLPKRLVTLITQMLEMDVNKRPTSIKVVEQELQLVSAPSAPKAAPRKRVLKLATPKQPTLTSPVAPISYTPSPASSAPTQYAAPPAPMQYPPTQVAPPLVTSVAYAPPPLPAAQGGQIYIPPTPVANFAPMPAQQPLLRKTLTVIGRVLSIIGMIIGVLSILIGILGLFVPNEGIITALWFGDLFIFLGLMIFFLARIRKSTSPVSRAKKLESAIGRSLGAIGIIFGFIIIILAAIAISHNSSNSDGGGTVTGVFSIIFSAVIWWATRIRIKKTP